MLDEIMTFH